MDPLALQHLDNLPYIWVGRSFFRGRGHNSCQGGWVGGTPFKIATRPEKDQTVNNTQFYSRGGTFLAQVIVIDDMQS